jgi:hypothetical protein
MRAPQGLIALALHSFNVVHMPQGCGWVIYISLNIKVDIQRNSAGLGPQYGKMETNGQQGYTLPLFFCWYTCLKRRVLKGEIDIVEGVNNQDANVVTLHTAPGRRGSTGVFSGVFSWWIANAGCFMPQSRAMTGWVATKVDASWLNCPTVHF